jgi:hypothetical protein
MRNLLRAAGGFLLAISLSTTLAAQTTKQQPPSRRKPPEAKAMTEKASDEKALSPQQQRALLLLDSLAEKTKELEDGKLKIRVQAQIADTLWPYNEARARRQFEDAFRAIEAINIPAKREGEANLPNSIEAVLRSPKFGLRHEVLQMVSRHDAAFAGTLMKLIEDTPAEEKAGKTINNTSFEQVMQSLHLANMIADTNPERAAQMARHTLQWGFHPWLSTTLIAIRHKNPSLANQVFNEALAVVQREPFPVVEHLVSLSAYVAPSEEERLLGRDITLDPVRFAVVEPFLNFAHHAILWHFSAEQARQTPDGQPVKVAAPVSPEMLEDILPLFDQYRPDLAASIRARLGALLERLSLKQLDALSRPQIQQSTQDLLSKAEATGNPQRKDDFYSQAAMLAFRQDDDVDQALSIAQKIGNYQDRAYITSNIRYQAGMKAIEKKDFEAGYRCAKEITHLTSRAIIFDRLAQRFLANKDSSRASELLDEIEKWLSKADNGPRKAEALLKISRTAASYDPLRGFEFMQAAVKAINVADFDLEAQKKAFGEGKYAKLMIPLTIDRLDFQPGFSLLAKADFDRSVLLAQSLEKKEALLMSQLAVCHGILSVSLSQKSESKETSSPPEQKR